MITRLTADLDKAMVASCARAHLITTILVSNVKNVGNMRRVYTPKFISQDKWVICVDSLAFAEMMYIKELIVTEKDNLQLEGE